MPVVVVTMWEQPSVTIATVEAKVRAVVSQELSTPRKVLGEDQISLRIGPTPVGAGICSLEVEVLGHAFLQRLWKKDRRANRIAKRLSDELGMTCGCWINLALVGFSRS